MKTHPYTHQTPGYPGIDPKKPIPMSMGMGFLGSGSGWALSDPRVTLANPYVGLYGVHPSGSGMGGTSSMGLSSSGSSGMAGVGSMYNSIEECSHLCPWLYSKGERVRCRGEGGWGSSFFFF